MRITVELLCICNKCIGTFLQGTYISSGMDMNKLIEGHNFPKVYFYGKYKAIFKFINVKNVLLGCGVLEFNLIRPWETPI